MKFKDKFGNDIECTPDEYKILMGEPVAVTPNNIDLFIREPKPKAIVHSGAGKLSGGSCGKKWSMKERKILRQNFDKPMSVLLKLLPDRSSGAIMGRLAVDKIKKVVPYVVPKPHIKYSSEELNLLSLHRDDSLDSLERMLPNHSRGSILDKLYTLYGRSKSERNSVPKGVGNGNAWTDSDLNILRSNLNDLDRAKLLLADRHSVGSVNVYASKLRKSLSNISLTKNSGKPYKHGKLHGNHNRMVWLNSRARYYMEAFKWDRNKAYLQASEDWKNNQSSIGTIRPDTSDTLFKVVKFDFVSQKYVVVEVFASEDDAKKCLDDCKIADKTLDGGSQFSIVKIKKGVDYGNVV